MMRKFILKTLMIALFVAFIGVGMSSCKNYDDDINGLKDRVETVENASKTFALQTALDEVKTVAESAMQTANLNASQLTTINEAATSVGKTSAQAIIDGVNANKAVEEMIANKTGRIDSIVNDLGLTDDEIATAYINALVDYVTADELSVYIKTLVLSDEAIIKLFDNAITALWGSVTNITLRPDTNTPYNTIAYTYYNTTIPADYVFGSITDSPVTYVKGAAIGSTDDILIQVNPANAVITADNIKLVDSKGRTLDDYVDVTVKKSNKVITRGSDLDFGLYTVNFTLKNGIDGAKFDNVVKDGANNIAYAIAINNAPVYAESRYVFSPFIITQSRSTVFTPATVFTYADLKYYKGNTNLVDATHDGTAANPIDIVNTYALTLSIDDAVANYSSMDYFYIDFDNEAAAADLTAWKKFNISGLKKMTKATEKLTVTVNDVNAINKTMSFKIYIVNKNGNVVVADGSKFYIRVKNNA